MELAFDIAGGGYATQEKDIQTTANEFENWIDAIHWIGFTHVSLNVILWN